MSRKNKRNNPKKLIGLIILILAIVLILMLLVISILLKNSENTNSKEENNVNIVIDGDEIVANENESELNSLKEMTERNRIEYYVSRFIRCVEEGKYEDAYNMLNREFKENYFSTINDFKTYSENKFTKMLDIEYTNFERNGQIYVIWLTMTDAINGTKNSGEEMNFVVKENDFNDFELSFSVK